MTTTGKSASQGRTWKWLGAVSLFLLGLTLLYAQYVRVQPPSLTENMGFLPPMLTDSKGQLKPPSESERAAVLGSLNLTPEQQEQVAALDARLGEPKGPGDFIRRMGAMQEILTPEQQVLMRRAMGDQMEGRMREKAKVLPPDQKEKFEEKLASRRADMEARAARGENPFPFGGPPR